MCVAGCLGLVTTWALVGPYISVFAMMYHMCMDHGSMERMLSFWMGPTLDCSLNKTGFLQAYSLKNRIYSHNTIVNVKSKNNPSEKKLCVIVKRKNILFLELKGKIFCVNVKRKNIAEGKIFTEKLLKALFNTE